MISSESLSLRLLPNFSTSSERKAASRRPSRLGLLLLAALVFFLSTGWNQQQGATEGVMAYLDFQSPTEGTVGYMVYTPPGYYTPGNTDRYPVLYFLHGSGDDETAFAEALLELPTSGTSAAEKLDDAILTDQLPPMILVAIGSPNTSGTWGEDLTTLVTEEMVGHIDRNWRTIADRRGRSIEGFSAGAQAVARYLTPNPELYASASVMGGGFENYRWSDHGEMISIRGTRVNLLTGDQDQFLPGAQELDGILGTEGIDHQFEIVPGVPHNCNLIYEARGLQNLQFHAAAWEAESVVEAGPDVIVAGGAPATITVDGEVLGTGSYSTDWQQIGGPTNAANFVQGFAPGTDVTFDAIGTYALRFSATDSTGTYDDVLTVAVVDVSDSLEMHLPFDTDSMDATGNGHDGVEQGGVALSASGKIGGAYRFDGVDDLVVIPDFDYGATYSVAFWFKADDLTGSSYQYMWSHNGFDKANSSNAYLPESFTSANGNVRSVLRDTNDSNGQYIDAAGEFEDGAWHHYVIAVGPDGSRIYIDGEESTISGQGGDAFDPTTDVVIGGRSISPANRYYDGLLDDVRLYTRKLQPAEAKSLGETLGADTAPTADAGPDIGIQEVEDAVLLGTVVDDGISNLSVTWSQVSGPGTATFSHGSNAATSAVFDTPGVYVLQLTATDGVGASSDTMTVAIQAASAPVGHWMLDDGSGTVATDASVQGNDGSLYGNSGSPTWTADGLSFDSSDEQAVILGQHASLNLKPAETDISLVAWIRLSPGAEGTILSKAYGSLSQRQFQLYLYDADRDGQTSLYGLIGGKANNNAKNVVVDDGNWHMVAVVHDTATMTNTMYVDGVAIGGTKASGSATNAVDVIIGARRNNSSNTGLGWELDGEIGDAKIYAWELTPAEMSALYGMGPN